MKARELLKLLKRDVSRFDKRALISGYSAGVVQQLFRTTRERNWE
jgi:hypothetical protein